MCLCYFVVRTSLFSTDVTEGLVHESLLPSHLTLVTRVIIHQSINVNVSMFLGLVRI